MEVTMPTTHTDAPALAADGASAGAGASPSTVRRFGRMPARWLEAPGIGVDELAVLTALVVHADRDGVVRGPAAHARQPAPALARVGVPGARPTVLARRLRREGAPGRPRRL